MRPLIDDELISLLNKPAPAWADAVLGPLSNHYVLAGISVATLLYVGMKSRSGWVGAGALLIAMLLADFASAHVAAPFFERSRPCAEAGRSLSPQGCPSGFSLPSRQAAAAAAGGVVFSAAAPWLSGIAVAAVVLIGAARIWLGDAHATDVIAGYFLGAAFAGLLLSASRLRFLHPKNWEKG